jgi:DNA-binding MarR family transcriptional regulator
MTTPPTRAHAEAAARLRTTIARLNRVLRQQNVGDLTLSQWSALVAVESDGPMRIGDLAEREHVSAPTATRLVSSLESAGLVQRVVDSDDRRSTFVSLTEDGTRALAEARKLRTAALAERLSSWSGEDVDRLVDALPLLERLAELD